MAGANVANRIRVLSLRKQFGKLTASEEAEFQRLKQQLRQMKLQETRSR